ncbi:MAG: tRNA 2-thiocytidine(32) synthetase TtcA [Desulfobacter sp.]|nr:tRNA 2-thiocytidine(32) synthetase TtcA [Desulfobacter sp.]WDP85942.1 MAG: tRNA 2-thiocytidine(32) synthetase TtcA [Desulfobacter sp.]
MGRGLQKKVNRGFGKAVHDWKMIADQDRILVGVSGGKDSLILLHLLASLKKKAPVEFELFPVHIDPGFKDCFAPDLKRYVNSLDLPLHIEYTDYGVLAHSDKNRENPCFLCSHLRRKCLFELSRTHQCGKIALGHNKDDLIETLFINIFYAGKIGTMKPKQSFFQGSLDIIRPLSYLEKDDITRLCRMQEMPEFVNSCPSADLTKRGEIRKMLEGMYRQNKHIKGNIFRAMGNVASDYLLKTPS